MTQDSVRQSAESMAAGTRRPEGAMAMCPMAKMCAGMTQKRFPSVLTMLPGILLIVLGVLIVIEPGILVWLVAAASVLLGIMLLMMASFIRKIGAQLRM
ncbi:MAG: hypothetical protein OEO84_00035 [Betaproteobacteria bacterium]|nr:hypothetical protein [Betaproteobacteria bacterium]MDH5537734.1 hypothetical protein [Betaproteobacteria bacterium]